MCGGHTLVHLAKPIVGWQPPETGTWGLSSVGRAVVWQTIGQEFNSPRLHADQVCAHVPGLAVRACSSIGRASVLHTEGRAFNSRRVHQY